MQDAFRNNHQRAPHWRWLRALQADTSGPRANARIDGPDGYKWIRRALKLKRNHAKAVGNPAKLYMLSEQDPALFWAHNMWTEDKIPTKWAIEAHVLADEPVEEIAQRIGADPSVVEAYEAVFFDVRSRLANREYIINVVMKDAVTRGLTERNYDLLWKLFGYQCGSVVLDAMINRMTVLHKPTKAEDLSSFFNDAAIGIIKQKATIAALTVPVNSHTQMLLIDSFVKYTEIERTTDNASRAQATIIENVNAMLGALPFRVGTKLESEQSKMLPYDNNAAELRGEEMLTIVAGGVVENTEALQDLSFPER